ncbi:mitochondrial amidoxime reducing component 2-like isoform X2 [Odontomachus brunneus]|nr:mitochondrial amidoxime reducing component 2-like isoform X2 [Odontomachus brunneus]
MQNLTILKKYHKRHINNPSLKWRKVGVVKHLFVYPLVNVATAQNVMSCYIHRNEIVGCNNGVPIRNHMFVVYDEKTNIIETDNEMHNFTNMIISIKDENTIILKDVNVESMPLVLKNFVVDKNRKTCIMSFAHEFLVKVEVSDCGQMAAEWLKSYTKNWNLRLGYLLRDLKPQKTFMHQYHSLNLENQNCKNMMIPFENIPCLTLLSSTSFKEVEKILPYTSLQMLRPNIFISTFEKPFNEIKWQEIKIGNAICNNVKPWKRSKSQINFTDMSIDMKKEKMLLHCEVLFPWPVKEGDNVYVLEEEDN